MENLDELQFKYVEAKEYGVAYSEIVSQYDFEYAQIEQVIAGFEDGLSCDDVETYADHIFDSMQMFWIRYGLAKWNSDMVMLYAQPSYSAEQMREIVLCYERGIGVSNVGEYFTPDIPAKLMAKRRYSLMMGNENGPFTKTLFETKRPLITEMPEPPPVKKEPEFTRDQTIIIDKARSAGFTVQQLSVLANPGFEPKQMEQIVWGFVHNDLSVDQVNVFAAPEFQYDQMAEIRKGITHGIPMERVRRYADSRFNARQMTHLRLAAAELSEHQFSVIADPDIPAYKMGELITGFRQGYTLEEMEEM